MNPATGVLLAAALAAQSAPAPDDFAGGLLLEIDGSHPLYRIAVPESVYRGVTRADLGDLRVFDAQGRVVPHRLVDRRRETPVVEPRWVTVPHFRVPSARFEPGNRLNLRIEQDGTLIEFERVDTAQSEGSVVVHIVDLSRLGVPVTRLEVIFEEGASDFIAPLEIEGSSDLNNWETVVRQATLISLRYAGQKLAQNVIELPGAHRPYLRLRWLHGNGAAPVREIHASVTGTVGRSPETEYDSLGGRAAAKQPQRAEFDTGGFFPITHASIELRANAAIHGRLGSRSDPAASWTVRQSGVFYALQRDETTVKSGPMATGTTNDRYWYFEDLAGQPVARHFPRLTIAWVPHDLVFLAEGKPPYTLAYGSGRITGSDDQAAAIVATLTPGRGDRMIGTARLVRPVPLGGEESKGKPPTPLPWARILLWAILIGGVVAVAAMAWWLVRQLRTEA